MWAAPDFQRLQFNCSRLDISLLALATWNWVALRYKWRQWFLVGMVALEIQTAPTPSRIVAAVAGSKMQETRRGSSHFLFFSFFFLSAIHLVYYLAECWIHPVGHSWQGQTSHFPKHFWNASLRIYPFQRIFVRRQLLCVFWVCNIPNRSHRIRASFSQLCLAIKLRVEFWWPSSSHSLLLEG